jgi:hypothetical protein
MKFMKTMIWLRDARDRLGGGGVPGSGRNASLAVLGVICRGDSGAVGGSERRPNSIELVWVSLIASNCPYKPRRD